MMKSVGDLPSLDVSNSNSSSPRRPRSETNQAPAPSWDELPADMICEIAKLLPNFVDIKSLLTVCKQWNSVSPEITRPSFPLPFPLLMLSKTLNTNWRSFFNLCDSKRYRLELSTFGGKRCWGSPYGWVVLLDPNSNAHLEHLGKGRQIILPSLNTIRTLAATEEWFRLIHKFIIFKQPSHESSFLVIAIFGPENSLAFVRVGEGAALNGRGQDEWVLVANPDEFKFKDVTCFNDQIYGLCDNGTLVRVELDAEVQVVSPQPEDVWEPQKLYLVELFGNLFGVFRHGYYYPLKRRYETASFSVYKFNFDTPSWVEVRNGRGLEDHAVFVGDGNSWCCPTITISSSSKRIYFTDDNWDWQMCPGGEYGGCDVGVFDMKTREIQPLPFGEDNPSSYSRPIWVTTTMRLY
ncbi:F-box protein At2g26160-like isoform X1 [Quercus robur]|uniref:F-box protein At2g26160-like isoform X1 n=2 Tax=Quercus robur TaxID=38942 RepID=UPI002161FB7F|nr:F-box protein At2g26160-like isoform X1 [Quercus robur]XP_050245285.1 F-box protein At2g26160-like isoform X1 [Quercus robur]XP_050245286.1 F-box protein At2g26160-like isoform X1 [Quercus robur]XP_050245287.1 F-box protein At2g26160-like isoform X1 [Quercus robur]